MAADEKAEMDAGSTTDEFEDKDVYQLKRLQDVSTTVALILAISEADAIVC